MDFGTAVIRFRVIARRPPIQAAIQIGELARRSAMAQYGCRNAGRPSALLAGKRADGQPLQAHRHTHYLSTDEDGDGLIDHLTFWTPIGLDRQELEATWAIPWLVGLGRGRLDLEKVSHGEHQVLPHLLRGPAQVWRSHTPYIMTRHPKRRCRPDGTYVWIDPIEQQIRGDLEREGLGDQLLALNGLPGYATRDEMIGWGHFRRARLHRPPPIDFAAGYELVFAAPVAGPITLGYGRHHGLGLWIAATD